MPKKRTVKKIIKPIEKPAEPKPAQIPVKKKFHNTRKVVTYTCPGCPTKTEVDAIQNAVVIQNAICANCGAMLKREVKG